MYRQESKIVEKENDYELMDSGEGYKLERFGDVVMARPDPEAIWKKSLEKNVWDNVNVEYIKSGDGRTGKWKWKTEQKNCWQIKISNQKMLVKPTPFKHTGVFPEQIENWKWLSSKVKEGDEILNLFGYTGGATIACLSSSAKVVHVDGSKSAINWARENAKIGNVDDKPVRWILEDARVFVEREIKRGRKYQGIVMDPPAFGHGANKEVWKIEEDLLPLINKCISILDKDNAKFFLINGYASGYSPVAYGNLLSEIDIKGEITVGEIGIKESMGKERILPAGIYAKWERI